jgi:hypothetical protein
MPGTIRLGALLALLAVAMALPGCGSDEVSGEIPADNAADLKSALADVRLEIEAGCTDPDQAREQAQAFVDEVNRLPADPSGELKTELQEAADHLRNLVDSECASTEPPTTTQSTAATTDASTTTSSTEDTTTTEPTTTDTTATDTTTSTDDAPPPGDGHGNGPGDGGTGGTGGPSDGDDE